MKFISSGIKNFDKCLGGGYVNNSATLITGGPGTGKSILGLQFLYDGLKNKEKVLLISFEENKDVIMEQSNNFGWEFEKYIKNDQLKIINFDMPSTHVVHVIESISKEVKTHNPKRIVLDSLSVLSLFAEVAAGLELAHLLNVNLDQLKLSQEVLTIGAVMGLLSKIKKYDNTSLIIAEIPQGKNNLSRDSFTEFICDGVIKLVKDENTGKRHLNIIKNRTADHTLTPVSFSIDKKGIELK
ncbi:MAG: ATPase domain-containing protein [Candidatus Micrarchaeia archaeon]|jgi:circadian clock protein KaiC